MKSGDVSYFMGQAFIASQNGQESSSCLTLLCMEEKMLHNSKGRTLAAEITNSFLEHSCKWEREESG